MHVAEVSLRPPECRWRRSVEIFEGLEASPSSMQGANLLQKLNTIELVRHKVRSFLSHILEVQPMRKQVWRVWQRV